MATESRRRSGAAAGPGGTGTALGQVARECGVRDGGGRAGRSVDTAAEAVTGGDATAPGCTHSRLSMRVLSKTLRVALNQC